MQLMGKGEMERRWQVLPVVVRRQSSWLSLDLFIVNIAFPDIQADFPGTSLGGAVLGAQRLRDRLRGAARPRRPAGRRVRAASASSSRARRSSRCRVGLRGLARPSSCSSRPASLQAAGAALDHPDVARAAAAGVPAPQERAEVDRALGRRRRRRGAAAGPPVGGLLVQLSWRWVFLVNLPIGVGAMIAGAPVLTEVAGSRRRARRTCSAPARSCSASPPSWGRSCRARPGAGRSGRILSTAGDERRTPGGRRPSLPDTSVPRGGPRDRQRALILLCRDGARRSSSSPSPRCCWAPSSSSPPSGASRR